MDTDFHPVNQLTTLLGPTPTHPWEALIPQILLWSFRRFCIIKLSKTTDTPITEQIWDDHMELIRVYAPKGLDCVTTTWITDENIDIYDGKISNERVLRLIEDKRHPKPDVTYMFIDSWTFLVDLEPEHIQVYSQTKASARFLTQLRTVDDIIIPPSIFIFHDVNAVYFLFQEVERLPAKSAFRNKLSGNKSTKRVTYSTQFNKTRKNISNI